MAKSARELATDAFELLIECGICTDVTELKLLPCQHTLCNSCLVKIIAGPTPQCPYCKIRLQNAAADYPVCRMANQLTESLSNYVNAVEQAVRRVKKSQTTAQVSTDDGVIPTPSKRPHINPDSSLSDNHRPTTSTPSAGNVDSTLAEILAGMNSIKLAIGLQQEDISHVKRAIGLDNTQNGSVGIVEQITNINDLIGIDEWAEPARAKLGRNLMHHGGATIADSVKGMLKALATLEVFSAFSMKGQKGKRPFAKTVAYDIVRRAVAKYHGRNTTMAVIEAAVAEYLKFAPARLTKERAKYQAGGKTLEASF